MTVRHSLQTRASLLVLCAGLVVGLIAPNSAASDTHDAHAAAAQHESQAASKETPPSRPAAKKPASTTEAKPSKKAAIAPPEPIVAPTSPVAGPAAAETDSKAPDSKVVDASEALKLLTEGNARWVANQAEAPNTSSARRLDLASKGQKPFVTILSCADSRVPIERVFDRGVGEVFSIRVAGNVSGPSETGTIEYGIGHLKTPLLVVMGHTKCGAVAAAASGAKLHGCLGDLVSSIQPSVDRARKNNPGVDDAALVSIAIKENVWQSVFQLLKNSSELREAVQDGKLKVVGAVYDLASGKVDFLGEHPWQGELMDALAARAKRDSNVETASAESDSGH